MECVWPVDDILVSPITKFSQNDIIRFSKSCENRIRYFSSNKQIPPHDTQNQPTPTNGDKLRCIIDTLGHRSGCAQGLGYSITSFDRVQYGDRHTIYILREDLPKKKNRNNDYGGHRRECGGGDSQDEQSDQSSDENGEPPPKSPEPIPRILGFLKVGYKSLFLLDQNSNQNEVHPLCVLDFYVYEHFQRNGFGRKLFDFMTKDLRVLPVQLAIDRPSSKFKNFLRKHYHLTSSVPQVNNFVIFDGFFRHYKENSHRTRNHKSSRHSRFDENTRSAGQRPRRESSDHSERKLLRSRTSFETQTVAHASSGNSAHAIGQTDGRCPLLRNRTSHPKSTISTPALITTITAESQRPTNGVSVATPEHQLTQHHNHAPENFEQSQIKNIACQNQEGRQRGTPRGNGLNGTVLPTLKPNPIPNQIAPTSTLKTGQKLIDHVYKEKNLLDENRKNESRKNYQHSHNQYHRQMSNGAINRELPTDHRDHRERPLDHNNQNIMLKKFRERDRKIIAENGNYANYLFSNNNNNHNYKNNHHWRHQQGAATRARKNGENGHVTRRAQNEPNSGHSGGQLSRMNSAYNIFGVPSKY